MGMTATVQCMMQLGFTVLSCDNDLKFDWYCQLSGSASCQAVFPMAWEVGYN